MQVNICRDIEEMKKQYGQYKLKNIDETLQDAHSEEFNDFKDLENSINNLKELLKSMEDINSEVIISKNLLKNILDEDLEAKKKCIEKIKNIINAYVNFYDHVDSIKQSIEKSHLNTDEKLLKVINSILLLLEKEYLNIGLMINIPTIGVDKFDGFKHEIVSTEKRLELSNETIINVVKRGFYYNDRNIRYIRNAKVVTVLN